MYHSPQTDQIMCFLWTDLSTSLEFAAIRNWLQRCLSTSWSWESASVVLVAAPPAWVGQIWNLRVFSLSFQLVERIFSIGKLQIQRPTWVLTSCVSICFYMFLCVSVKCEHFKISWAHWITLDHLWLLEVLYALQYELARALQLPPHRPGFAGFTGVLFRRLKLAPRKKDLPDQRHPNGP